MRKNKIAVCLMTALLLPVMALTELVSMQEENYPLSAEILTSGGSEKIACWWKQGCYYVFLPSGADPNRTKLVTDPLDLMFLFWAISIGLCCGASMYIISALGSVMLAVVLVVFARHPYDSAAYLLVVRGQAGALPTADIRAALDACSSRIRLRMSNSTAHEDEMTWELYLTGKGDSTVENLHDRLAALSGISSINIVSYAGETLG